jgi:hypothetical protein
MQKKFQKPIRNGKIILPILITHLVRIFQAARVAERKNKKILNYLGMNTCCSWGGSAQQETLALRSGRQILQ